MAETALHFAAMASLGKRGTCIAYWRNLDEGGYVFVRDLSGAELPYEVFGLAPNRIDCAQEMWLDAVADAVREVREEEDRAARTAVHEEPAFDPRTGHFPGLLYDVHGPNGVITARTGDLTRTLGDATVTGRPVRVRARLYPRGGNA